MGVGLPPWARHPPWPAPSSTPLYMGAGGTPETQQLIIDLLAVCGAPSTIILDNIVAVLRRSPAMVEHQDSHHAVVLTEFFPDILLDRNPGNVIELNVCKNSKVP